MTATAPADAFFQPLVPGLPPGVTVGWAPQLGSQRAFLRSPVFETLYEGTRGPGKTDALLMDFAQFTGMGYGADWRGVLFRQTYKQLGDVIAKSKKWFPVLWPSARYNQSEHYWTWPGGEQLLFRQFMHDDDYWNYHGHEYPWVGWEELCNWPTLSGYLRMMSVCRSPNPDVPRRYRATTNPYGPGHNAVKFRFRLPAWRNRIITDATDPDGRPEPPRLALHGHIRENKVLLRADPEYINRIVAAARNPAERAAWLEGSWDIVSGGMFDDVWSQSNVVSPFAIPSSWRIDRSFDWGSSKPFSVGWWAESDGTDLKLPDGSTRYTVRGDLFRIGEWYGWNGRPNEGLQMLARDVARGIVEREILMGIHGRARPGPADSSIFDVQNGNCIAHDMEAKVRLKDGREFPGVSWTKADKSPGSRKNGWELTRAMMKAAGPTEHGGPREKPGLFVFTRCDQFIRTVPTLPRDGKDPDDVDTDSEDHVGDEIRYRVLEAGSRLGQVRAVGVL